MHTPDQRTPVSLGQAFEQLAALEDWADGRSLEADVATTRARLHTLSLSAPLDLYNQEIAPFVRNNSTSRSKQILGENALRISALLIDPETLEFGVPEPITLGSHQRAMPLCGRFLLENGQLSEPSLPIDQEVNAAIVDNPDFNRVSGLRGWLHAKGRPNISIPAVEMKGTTLANCDEPERYMVALSAILNEAGVSRQSLRHSDAPHLTSYTRQKPFIPWPVNVALRSDLSSGKY